MEDDYEETIFEEIEEGLFNDGDLTINEEYLTSFNAACDDVCTNAEAGRDIIQRMMDKCGGLVDFGSDRDALEASYKKLCRVGNYKAAMNRYVTAVSEFDRNLADRFITIRSEDNDQENKEWTDINEELAFRADTVMSPTPVANMCRLSGSSILPVSEENNAISSATASYAGMMRADYDRNKNVDTMFTQCSTVEPTFLPGVDDSEDKKNPFDIEGMEQYRFDSYNFLENRNYMGNVYNNYLQGYNSYIPGYNFAEIQKQQEAAKKKREKLEKILEKPVEKITDAEWNAVNAELGVRSNSPFVTLTTPNTKSVTPFSRDMAETVFTELEISEGVIQLSTPTNAKETSEMEKCKFVTQRDSFQEIDKYYSVLPQGLKNYLSNDDILVSNDGYVMLTKSMADILVEMGITDTNISETNKNDVQYYYDDWYIYGIKDDTGNITYSLVKMREKENDSNIGDRDEPGVTISFIEFDINKLTSLCVRKTDEKINELVSEIDRVIKQNGQNHNAILQEYFSKTESKAPYIIADTYIKKVANNAENNRVELPDDFENAPARLVEALERINEEAGYKIYDENNKCIHIDGADNLSDEEKYAILTAYTSNVSYNSFAAEVEFHSDALVDWKKYIPILGKSKWYESAIRADMAFGEEIESNCGGGFDEYYDLDSKIVKMQAEIHGEK